LASLKNLLPKEVKIGLWTGTKKHSGDFDILVGTHALYSKNTMLDDISLIVIDEQHKFGVEQINKLTKKRKRPHVLTMTATPIPRTVALTFFGDMDLSILDELPKGRQKITTWVVPKEKRLKGYEWIRNKIINEKVQAFVVCPLIESSDTQTLMDTKAVKKVQEELVEKFPDLNIGLLHGRMKPKEKDLTIANFKDGKINIMVTTPVVEVGIDIPNATIMIIEGADRFGLASLHQLRGRVGRGNKKSYCLLLSQSDSEKTKIRLEAMTKNNSGFKLAELDLSLRGPGEIYGTKQSGMPELKIANWSDVEMIKNTKLVAKELLDKL
jgi:ATP-dependent DNA helicase RecG